MGPNSERIHQSVINIGQESIHQKVQAAAKAAQDARARGDEEFGEQILEGMVNSILDSSDPFEVVTMQYKLGSLFKELAELISNPLTLEHEGNRTNP